MVYELNHSKSKTSPDCRDRQVPPAFGTPLPPHLHSVGTDEASACPPPSTVPASATARGERIRRQPELSPYVSLGLTFTFWTMGPSTLLSLEFHLRSRLKMVDEATPGSLAPEGNKPLSTVSSSVLLFLKNNCTKENDLRLNGNAESQARVLPQPGLGLCTWGLVQLPHYVLSLQDTGGAQKKHTGPAVSPQADLCPRSLV